MGDSFRFAGQSAATHELTPKLVAMADRMASSVWMMNFQRWFLGKISMFSIVAAFSIVLLIFSVFNSFTIFTLLGFPPCLVFHFACFFTLFVFSLCLVFQILTLIVCQSRFDGNADADFVCRRIRGTFRSVGRFNLNG